MGAEQSNSSNTQRPKRSQDEVDRLLAQQRLLYEQRYAELLRITKTQQQNNALAEKTAREEARKEVERVMKEKQEQLLRQNAQQLNANVPKTPENSRPLSNNNIDRERSAYICAGAVPTNSVLAPNTPVSVQNATAHPISPNLNNAAYTGQVNATPSSLPGPRRTPERTGDQPAKNNSSIPPLMANYPSVSRQETRQEDIEESFVVINTAYKKPNYPQGILVPLPRAPSAPPAYRERSLSRSRNKRPQEDDELNCPTCKNRYSGNIYQCMRGHSSCQNCKFSSKTCGAVVNQRGPCALPISEMRNITLEAYICERKVHCPNSAEGCCLYIKLADLESHVKECPFREMECPLRKIFGQCSWRGKLSQVASHFDKFHQMHRQGNVDIEMILLNLTSDNHIVYLVVMGPFNFLFHAKVSEKDKKLYMAVTLLGTNHSAAKWSYEIHIYNKKEPRRKYQYSDICRSANTAVEELGANYECASIPLAYASTFICDGCLTYKFLIKKDGNESRNNFGNRQHGRGGATRRV